jgi:hypothetical protein
MEQRKDEEKEAQKKKPNEGKQKIEEGKGGKKK